jgi:hypothetical protein
MAGYALSGMHAGRFVGGSQIIPGGVGRGGGGAGLYEQLGLLRQSAAAIWAIAISDMAIAHLANVILCFIRSSFYIVFNKKI